jgi:hypothetical protein
MLSKSQLLYKLELQSVLLEKSLNLPPNFGEEKLARAIYNFSNFDELYKQLIFCSEEDIHSSILEHPNLKYLMINEIEDAYLIQGLHKEIEEMVTRLESLVIINMTKIQLISNLYELFGLGDESKYVISAEGLELNWQSPFSSLQDKEVVLCSDLKINNLPVRLVATKVELNEVSLDQRLGSLNKNLVQDKGTSFENHEEKLQIDLHRKWFFNSSDCLLNLESSNVDKHPEFFKINNQNYFVYGFPLSPHLSMDSNGKLANMHASA